MKHLIRSPYSRFLSLALTFLCVSATGFSQSSADNPAPTSVLWSADFETGNTSQWSANKGGAQVNSGSASAQAVTNYTHSGRWALKMTTNAPPEGGTSMIRWQELQESKELNYSVWYYFPQRYSAPNYWNVLQWSSRNPANGQVNPFFVLGVGNRGDGSMYFYLFNWQTRKSYMQTVKNIPVGQWLNIQAHYASSGDGTGRVTIWQDGTKLFDVPNVQTRYANGDSRWSVNNLSDGIRPAPATIYVDDVVIGTSGSTVPSVPKLTESTTSLPKGTVGAPYSATLSASGGTPPYKWSLASGSLPAGLILNSGGIISGTPSSGGVHTASFRVTDSAPIPQTATSASLSMDISAAATGNVIWSADTETGDLSQWYSPATTANGNEGGGMFNSGNANTTATQERARSGNWSLKMNITTPPESGTRMFRWKESKTYRDLTYSSWFYIPQRYSVTNYWNIFQWKSKVPSTGRVDPFFVLGIGNRGNGEMYLYLYDWQKRRSYTQTLKDVPVGQWFNIKANYVCAGDNTGRVTFWQDGTKLFDIPNVQTRYSNGDCNWSIDNYSDGLKPSSATIYTDDAQIILK